MSEDELLKKDLSETFALFEKALEVLRQSLDTCAVFAGSDELDIHQMAQVEALCSRFARASDLFIQKLLGLVEQLDLEQRGTPRDRINNAEKKGIINSTESFILIRQFRNRVAHEYVIGNSASLLKEALTLSPFLFEAFRGLKGYCFSKKYL